MYPKPGRNRAGLDAELLDSVRKRKWQVDVRHRVGVVAAVQKVGCAIALAAGHRNPGRAEESLTPGVAGIAVGRCTQGQDQLSGLSPVQRKLIDALVVDYYRDR